MGRSGMGICLYQPGPGQSEQPDFGAGFSRGMCCLRAFMAGNTSRLPGHLFREADIYPLVASANCLFVWNANSADLAGL